MLAATKGRLAASALLALAAIFLPGRVAAATLSVAVPSGSHVVGDTVIVPVVVSTAAGETLNAVSGVVSFPTDKLQVVSVSREASVLNFWIADPSYSNAAGTVGFEGGVYNPGFSGSGAHVVSIVFRVKAAGEAPLSFGSASVLANDGKATNILTRSDGATLVAAEAVAPTQSVAGRSVSVRSPSHPDQDRWYDASRATFAWTLPADAEAVRLGVGQAADADPAVLYEPAVTEKEVDLGEGVWYFHVQARSRDGWGPVSTYRARVDLTPPQPFSVAVAPAASGTASLPAATWLAKDELSGIDHYEVRVANGAPTRVERAAAGTPFFLGEAAPGDYALEVAAYDRAGNVATSSTRFSVAGLVAPRLDPLPATIGPDDTLVVSGQALPGGRVTVVLVDESGQVQKQSTLAVAGGRFELAWRGKVDPGDYRVSALVEDASGGQSLPTEPLRLVVNEGAFTRFGWPLLNYLTLAAVLLGALAAVVAWATYLFSRLRHVRRRVSAEARVADRKLHRSFERLVETVSTQVSRMEKGLDRVCEDPESTKKKGRVVLAALRKALREAEDEVDEVLGRFEEED